MGEHGEKAYYPDIRQAVWLLICLFFLSVLVGVPLFLSDFWIDYPLLEHPACYGIISAVAFGLILRWGIRKTGRSFGEICPTRSVVPSLYPLMVLLILGLEILLSEADNVLRTFLPAPQWLMDQLLDLVRGEQSLWGSILVLVIVAPLTEELLFRGLILDGFLRKYSVTKSIFVSSLLFALYHLNPWQFIGAFVGGIILAWWRVSTGSIVPCILGHALKNAIPMIILGMKIEISGYSSDPTGPIQPQPWWFDVAGVILFVTAFFALQQRFAERAEANEV
jgi:membrane protease YdiL (CAAX protease family)